MAYVSIAVNVGSFNDLPHRQGIAHFLEHMIFMGSEKYPGENDWGEHISKNGGEMNAFTEFEYTNYQFKVGYSGLQKALDMQAWLFAKPLLAKDGMKREI
jgi:nardilysin